MAKISYSSDKEKLKYASKADLTILVGRYNAKQARINMADKYLQIKADKEKEEQKQYPNKDYIARCEKIMDDLLPSYQQIYEHQR